MPFARYCQARIIGEIQGQQHINVLNFGTDEAAADDAALVDLLLLLATALISCAVDNLMDAVTSDFRFVASDAKQLHPVMSDVVEDALGPGLIGQATPVSMSTTATLMSIRTGGGGKRGRGHIFLPPPGEGETTNSSIVGQLPNDALANFLICLRNKFIGPNKTTAFTLGVLSRKHLKDNPGDYAGAFRPATNLAIDTQLTTLRSRKVGHGG